MAPVLEIKNVTKRYANHVALKGVTLSVPPQSIYGLLGPNGAGKTSLIRIVNQITAPDEGEVLLSGEKLHPEHIAQIGYLPEERGLYKKMEVGEQVLYLARLKGMSRKLAMERVKRWFVKFEMQSWWKKKVEELSKGMQQKVQFIATVIHEPPILILDEPFTGFDPVNAELIKNELLEFRKNGVTIILSTHRMESVEEMCDHIALLNKSEKILEGRMKDIRNTCRSGIFEVEYAGHAISFAHALWAGFELLDTHHEDGITKAKVKLLGSHTPNDLLANLLPHVKIISFREVMPSMNDIFIRYVGTAVPQDPNIPQA